MVACPPAESPQAPGAVASSQLQLGIDHAAAGNTEEARRHLSAAVAHSPRDSRAWYWLAAVQSSPLQAADCLSRVVALALASREARDELARLEAELAFAGPACPLCGARADAAPDDCRACGARLTLDDPRALTRPRAVDLDRLHDAAARYAASPADDFRTHFARALAHLNLRQWPEGLAALRAAAARRPYARDFGAKVAAVQAAIDDLHRPPRCALVVDDSPTVRKLVTMLLEREGFRVVPAPGGFEAVNLLQQQTPDLIFLDIVLPGIDGFALCKVIREQPATARVPIVMLSGKDGFFDRLRAQAAGADGFLTKPFDAGQLLGEIARLAPRAGG